MLKKLCILFTLIVFCLVPILSFAEDVVVSGIGSSLITPDIAVTRASSLQSAKRDAVVKAITKLNGATASNDPKIQAAVDQIIVQIGDDKIADQQNSKDAANNFITRVTIRIDENELRKLIQDHGIASTTARNYSIMVVMDEFFTTPTDQSKPLRELVEYSHDKTATSDASTISSDLAVSSNTASAKSDYSGSANVSARQSSSATFNADDYGGGGYGSARQNSGYSASNRENANSSSDSTNVSVAVANLDKKSFDQKKDVVNFKKLVEYQPQNKGPEKNNYTYAALVREAGDLNFLDNDLFRSKYFTGKPLTMEEMQNSSELARFVAAARESKADYLMVGNSIIINNDKNPNTGAFVCDGLVTLKAYATEDGSVLTTDARNESATGNSPDACRVAVANKLAGFVGRSLGSNIQNYWKLRDMYGREYNIRLVSLLGNLSDDIKDSFAESVESIGGLQSKVNERKSTRSEYEVAITYKGDKSVARSISSALKKLPVFAKTERKVEGTTLKFCLEGPCPEK